MSSIIIARLLGPLMLAGAAAVLLNRKGIQKIIEEAGKNAGFIYLTGSMSLLAGLAIVQFHNVWVAGWQVLITILGWSAVVRGVARMLFPVRSAEMVEKLAQREDVVVASAVFSAIIGAILTVKGFTA